MPAAAAPYNGIFEPKDGLCSVTGGLVPPGTGFCTPCVGFCMPGLETLPEVGTFEPPSVRSGLNCVEKYSAACPTAGAAPTPGPGIAAGPTPSPDCPSRPGDDRGLAVPVACRAGLRPCRFPVFE